MVSRIFLAVFLLAQVGFSEIHWAKATLTRGMASVLDIDNDSVMNNYRPTTFTDYEFGLFGPGLLWMNPDGRVYSFFHTTSLITIEAGSLSRVLNLNEKSLLSTETEKISMDRPSIYKNRYGNDTTGLVYETQNYDSFDDIDTTQYFLIKTSQNKYALLRFSDFKLKSFVANKFSADLDKVTVEYWVQEDGSTDFTGYLDTRLNAPKNFAIETHYSMPVTNFKFSWEKEPTSKSIEYSVYIDSTELFVVKDTNALTVSYEQINNACEEHGHEPMFKFPTSHTEEVAEYPFHVKARYSGTKTYSKPSNVVMQKALVATSIASDNHLNLQPERAVVTANKIDISGLSEVENVSLFSLNGKVVFTKSGAQKVHSIESLANGIYILSITTKSNTITQRIYKK